MTDQHAARRVAEHALGPWAERVVESTPETREELTRNVATAIAQAVQEERADVLAYLDQLGESHPHAASLYRHAAHQFTSLNHVGCAAIRRAPTPVTGGEDE